MRISLQVMVSQPMSLTMCVVLVALAFQSGVAAQACNARVLTVLGDLVELLVPRLLWSRVLAFQRKCPIHLTMSQLPMQQPVFCLEPLLTTRLSCID